MYKKHRASKGVFYIGGLGIVCQIIEPVTFARCAFIYNSYIYIYIYIYFFFFSKYYNIYFNYEAQGPRGNDANGKG